MNVIKRYASARNTVYVFFEWSSYMQNSVWYTKADTIVQIKKSVIKFETEKKNNIWICDKKSPIIWDCICIWKGSDSFHAGAYVIM